VLESNPHLDLFVQIVCGWPDASVAFGPVQAKAASLLARELGLRADSPLFGTLRIVNSPHALPPGELSDAVVDLMRAALELVPCQPPMPVPSQTAPEGSQHGTNQPPRPSPLARCVMHPMLWMRFKAAVQRALLLADTVPVGEGGTPKRPTEFQMGYVQRTREAALAALRACCSALRALS